VEELLRKVRSRVEYDFRSEYEVIENYMDYISKNNNVRTENKVGRKKATLGGTEKNIVFSSDVNAAEARNMYLRIQVQKVLAANLPSSTMSNSHCATLPAIRHLFL
jgi:hypothetical protein